jgi:hypothetical protein
VRSHCGVCRVMRFGRCYFPSPPLVTCTAPGLWRRSLLCRLPPATTTAACGNINIYMSCATVMLGLTWLVVYVTRQPTFDSPSAAGCAECPAAGDTCQGADLSQRSYALRRRHELKPGWFA